MNLFYSPELVDQKEFSLSAEESHHAVRVLRLGAGEQVTLVNGRGGWFTAEIINPDPKACLVGIQGVQEDYGNPPYRLHIAIAPTKQIDRFEWFLEKATEIGISEITPLICERSERREVKEERLLKIVIAAMKQSLKAFHPVIHSQTSFTRFMSRNHTGTGMIAHCQPGPKKWIDQITADARNITILIGPEGDFSPSEIGKAIDSGFSPITLGDSRLRTETAGVVAVQTVSWIFR